MVDIFPFLYRRVFIISLHDEFQNSVQALWQHVFIKLCYIFIYTHAHFIALSEGLLWGTEFAHSRRAKPNTKWSPIHSVNMLDRALRASDLVVGYRLDTTLLTFTVHQYL